MPSAKVVQYRLSQALLRALTVDQRPTVNAEGKTVLEENPGKRPYRFSDGSQGAPPGFGFYVGPTGAFYEVRSRVGKKAVRLSLGSVQELSLAKAHEKAAAQRSFIRSTGEDPRLALRSAEAAQAARGLTVSQALQGYIRFLEEQQGRGKTKAAGSRARRIRSPVCHGRRSAWRTWPSLR